MKFERQKYHFPNEQYHENNVRDGVWSLIPGGAHIENLKKGDIIFSTTQTDALLKHGAIQGHARAYASGTVTSPGVMKAYAAAGNTPGFHFQGGAATVKPAGSGNSGNSGNSGLQHAIEDNTDACFSSLDFFICIFKSFIIILLSFCIMTIITFGKICIPRSYTIKTIHSNFNPIHRIIIQLLDYILKSFAYFISRVKNIEIRKLRNLI